MAVGSERDTAAIRRRWPVVAAIAATAAWASLAVLIARMYAGTPPGAGFDLELLLTVHAGAALQPETRPWVPHWVHLPKRELGMRRPLDVMLENGQAGIAAVLELVWKAVPSVA